MSDIRIEDLPDGGYVIIGGGPLVVPLRRERQEELDVIRRRRLEALERRRRERGTPRDR